MKKLLLLSVMFMSLSSLQAQWKPAGDRIMTRWAAEVNPSAPLPEYPRPQMERLQWVNLNGLWDYAILPKGARFTSAEGKILVPYPVESALSGVCSAVGADSELWYRRSFEVPSKWSGHRVILHFGAVDWKTDVWVNGIKVGNHTGGYTPFEMDITDALVKGDNTLEVRVWDPTDEGFQPRGKQVANPRSIWYTSVTGIWQTVWMEPVAADHIVSLKCVPDVGRSCFVVDATVEGEGIVEVRILNDENVIASSRALKGASAEVVVEGAHLWSPDDPFLYDMEVALIKGGKVVDCVRSYAAMRSISVRRDASGILRMQLNGKDLFQYGPLDQGWWPDGLYTAPTDEALLYDIRKTKDFGFNMIRKHVKVEPARWYYHCDRLGMLVWQDMPSGEKYTDWNMTDYWQGAEVERSASSEACWRGEWKEVMDYLYSEPCIVVWVPFNEGWGQFRTAAIAEWTKDYDPSRLVNPASGGNHFLHAGDILDIHRYPAPEMYLYDSKRVTVLGEYGGIGWPIEGHLWENGRNWGYIKFGSSKDVTDEYVKYAEILEGMIASGFSAAVYTQTTDVEIEVNGLMTYDRSIIKPEEDRIRGINSRIVHSLDNNR